MKKIAIIFLGMIFFSCNSQNSSENNSKATKTDTVEQISDESQKTTPKADEIIIEAACDEVKVLKFKEKDLQTPGDQAIELDLGKGYKVFDKTAWFGGNEWSVNNLEVKKDGETIYVFDREKTEKLPVIRNRKFHNEYPRVISKGENQVIILFDMVLPPNDMNIDALVIENGKFKKIELGTYTLLSDEKEMKDFFEKCFE